MKKKCTSSFAVVSGSDDRRDFGVVSTDESEIVMKTVVVACEMFQIILMYTHKYSVYIVFSYLFNLT